MARRQNPIGEIFIVTAFLGILVFLLAANANAGAFKVSRKRLLLRLESIKRHDYGINVIRELVKGRKSFPELGPHCQPSLYKTSCVQFDSRARHNPHRLA